MIEGCHSKPSVRVVTPGAIRAKPTTMLVLVAVAIDARYGSILELPCPVTTLARKLRMLAQQRKPCEIVVEG
jgi:hypothetical protein